MSHAVEDDNEVPIPFLCIAPVALLRPRGEGGILMIDPLGGCRALGRARLPVPVPMPVPMPREGAAPRPGVEPAEAGRAAPDGRRGTRR